MAETVGAHNSDLEGTRSRLLRGGSWKRQRIVMVIPASDTISSRVYLNHMSIGFPPNNGVVRILAQGMEVGQAYSDCIEQVLAHPDLSTWEYLMCAEHDNLIPNDGVLKILEHMEAHPELSAIGGLYFTKGPAGVAQIWGDASDPIINFRPQAPRVDGGLVECCGLGQGFTIFRLSMFKDARIKRPWFRTIKGKEGAATQDLAFWTEARKYGYRCAVACDVRVGHIDVKGEFGIPDFVW